MRRLEHLQHPSLHLQVVGMFGAALLTGCRKGSWKFVARKCALSISRPYRLWRAGSSMSAWSTVYRHLVTDSRDENCPDFNDGGRVSNDKNDGTDRKESEDECIPKEQCETDRKFLEDRTFFSEVFTVPNLITITRVAACPYLVYLIHKDEKEMLLIGLVLCAGSDWLDGYLARKWKQQSVLGAFIDPAADKILIGSLTIGLTLKGLIPIELATIIVLRDFLILCMGFVHRARGKRKEDFFFDTTNIAFEIVPSQLSKVNTGLQFGLLTVTTANFAFGISDALYIEPLWYITGVTTILSGLGYIDGSGFRKIVTKVKEGGKRKNVNKISYESRMDSNSFEYYKEQSKDNVSK